MTMALLHPAYHWYNAPEILNLLQLSMEDKPNVSQWATHFHKNVDICSRMMRCNNNMWLRNRRCRTWGYTLLLLYAIISSYTALVSLIFGTAIPISFTRLSLYIVTYSLACVWAPPPFAVHESCENTCMTKYSSAWKIRWRNWGFSDLPHSETMLCVCAQELAT